MPLFQSKASIIRIISLSVMVIVFADSVQAELSLFVRQTGKDVVTNVVLASDAKVSDLNHKLHELGIGDYDSTISHAGQQIGPLTDTPLADIGVCSESVIEVGRTPLGRFKDQIAENPGKPFSISTASDGNKIAGWSTGRLTAKNEDDGTENKDYEWTIKYVFVNLFVFTANTEEQPEFKFRIQFPEECEEYGDVVVLKADGEVMEQHMLSWEEPNVNCDWIDESEIVWYDPIERNCLFRIQKIDQE